NVPEARRYQVPGARHTRPGARDPPTGAAGDALAQPLQFGDLLRRQLGEIEVAVGITAEAVRAVDGAAAAAHKLAVGTHKADARDLVGDEHQIAVVHPDLHGMIEVAPFGQEVAGAVEGLHAVVLAVADQHLAEAVDPHGVRRGELARAAAGPAPGA